MGHERSQRSAGQKPLFRPAPVMRPVSGRHGRFLGLQIGRLGAAVLPKFNGSCSSAAWLGYRSIG